MRGRCGQEGLGRKRGGDERKHGEIRKDGKDRKVQSKIWKLLTKTRQKNKTERKNMEYENQNGTELNLLRAVDRNWDKNDVNQWRDP